MLDWVITGGTVVRGDGSPAQRADVGLKDGKVATVAPSIAVGEGTRQLKAEGMHVLPGFVDIHSHGDLYPLAEPNAPAMVHQGITTLLGGNCSLSVAPLEEQDKQRWRAMYGSVWGGQSLTWQWGSIGDYLDAVDRAKTSVNLGMLAGLGSIRLGLGGDEPTPCDPQRVYDACSKAMQDGAFGISLGLHYFPCCYADHSEMRAAAQAAADHGGILGIHMHSYGDDLEHSVADTLTIARETGVSLQISHLYAAGRRNWPRLATAIRMIEEAEADGVDVHFDRHPYAAGSTSILALLPPWVQEGGLEQLPARVRDPAVRDRIRRDIEVGIPNWDCFASLAGWDHISVQEIPGLGDRTVAEVAELNGTDGVDAVCDLVLEHGPGMPIVIHHMEEKGICDVLSHRLGMVGTDSMYTAKPHPRTFGSYPRWFARYVRDQGLMSLEEAVYKSAGMPCDKMGIRDRGRLVEGNWGDVVLFDYARLGERNSFSDPSVPPDGIEHVFVNGQPVKLNGVLVDSFPGQALRHARH